MKILIIVSYDGTNYNGYQLQGEKPTVALMLNRAAEINIVSFLPR